MTQQDPYSFGPFKPKTTIKVMLGVAAIKIGIAYAEEWSRMLGKRHAQINENKFQGSGKYSKTFNESVARQKAKELGRHPAGSKLGKERESFRNEQVGIPKEDVETRRGPRWASPIPRRSTEDMS
jgi:hypothetical protein